MYEVGAKIVYGSTGVCEVVDCTTPKRAGFEKGQLYYVLKPLYQNGMIYCPVDNKRVFMRPVISREKAEKLIDLIPAIRAEPYHSERQQEVSDHYRDAISSHDCADLIELVMSIYSKKQEVDANGRKLSQLDGKYMKLAEDLLYGEFSVALEIPKDNVQDYISQRVKDAGGSPLEG